MEPLSHKLAKDLALLPLSTAPLSGSDAEFPEFDDLFEQPSPSLSKVYFPKDDVPLSYIVTSGCAICVPKKEARCSLNEQLSSRALVPPTWHVFLSNTHKNVVAFPMFLTVLLSTQNVFLQRQRYEQAARIMRVVQLVQCAFQDRERRKQAASLILGRIQLTDTSTLTDVLFKLFPAQDLDAVCKWTCRVPSILQAVVAYVVFADMKVKPCTFLRLRVSNIPVLDQVVSCGVPAARIALDCSSLDTLRVCLQSPSYIRAVCAYLQMADRILEDSFFPVHRRSGWSRLVLYWPNSYMHCSRPAESKDLYTELHYLLEATDMQNVFSFVDVSCLQNKKESHLLYETAINTPNPYDTKMVLGKRRKK